MPFTGPSNSSHIVTSKQLFLVYNLPFLTILAKRREDGDELSTGDVSKRGSNRVFVKGGGWGI